MEGIYNRSAYTEYTLISVCEKKPSKYTQSGKLKTLFDLLEQMEIVCPLNF